MKKSKLIHKINPIKSKNQEYSLNKFITMDAISKQDFKGEWPLIDGIDLITLTYFLVDINLKGFKPRKDIGVTLYDVENKKSYSLNGIAKMATKFLFPHEAGIVKKQGSKFMDTRVFLKDLEKMLKGNT